MAEKFTSIEQREYDHLKSLYTASHTFSKDRTIQRVLRGWEMAVLRESEADGMGEVANDVFETGKKETIIFLRTDGTTA